MTLEQDNATTVAVPASPTVSSERLNVAILFYRLGPYHHARLKAAGTRLRVTGVEFSNVDPTYAWESVSGADGFDKLTLFSGVAVETLSVSRVDARMCAILDQLDPQVVAVPGWYDRCSLAALRWCEARRVPAVIMSESTAWDNKRKWWKEFLKRQLLKSCASGLVGGRAHVEYLAQLGIERSNIFTGYDAVDNEYFRRGADVARSRAAEERKRRGLPEKFFLASARFVPKKNLACLIRAYAHYRQAKAAAGTGQRTEIWDLVLLGDGPLKSDLSRLIVELGLERFVHLPGFKQYAELPAYYGLASAFVHASATEQWGLVVNEAMAAGLPVLVSNRCGCATDLVEEGRNGFSFEPENGGQLTMQMLKLSARNFPLSAFGAESRRIVETVGTSAFGEGIFRAAQAALQQPKANFSLPIRFYFLSLLRRMPSSLDKNTEAAHLDFKVKNVESSDKEFLVFRFKGRDVLAVPNEPKILLFEGVKRYQPFTRKRHYYRRFLKVAISCGCTRLFTEKRSSPLKSDIEFKYRRWLTVLEKSLDRPIAKTIVTWPSQESRQRFYVHLFDCQLRGFGFVKVAMNDKGSKKLELEAETLRALNLVSFKKVRVPRLICHERFDDWSYLVVEPLPENAKPLALNRNWNPSSLTQEFCGPKSKVSGSGIMGLSWWQDYTAALKPTQQVFHQELMRLLPLGAQVCRAHGDLGLSNMVSDGTYTWLYDWESSHAQAPALSGAVAFYLSFTVGRIPQNPAAFLARFQNHFNASASCQQRLDVMLALAFRSACEVDDAGRLMETWRPESI